MDVRQVAGELVEVYMNLAQAYEAEFSSLTGKLPNRQGVFALDTPLDKRHIGYLAFDGEHPVALANISIDDGAFEVCEFYVIPSIRKRKIGSQFIGKIWQAHPGNWQVKQIQGADHAVQFWRNALSMNGVSFTESEYEDVYWGRVNRQVFTITSHN